MTSYAAGAAYFFFLALIPILIILMSIIPYTPLNQEVITNWITDLFPDTFDSLLISIIDDVYKRNATVISVSAVATFWAASKAIFSLVRGLNAVFETKETRNMLWMRIKSGFYTIFFLAMIVIMLIINIFGDRLVDIILSDFTVFINVWTIVRYFRYLVVILLLTVLFTAMFCKLPNRKSPFHFQLPGAFIAALSWAACTRIFNIYIDNFSRFSMYGSLTTIIVMMLWFHMLMFLLLTGAEVNFFLEPKFRENAERRELMRKIGIMRQTMHLNDKIT